MNVQTLDKIIKQFWRNENKDTTWHTGFCSEFAVALDRFLNGAGQIGKQGWFHTIYIYKGNYCDVRGCMNENKLDFHNPIGSQGQPYPAAPHELQHINSLLNEGRVQRALAGLKRAQREVKM